MYAVDAEWKRRVRARMAELGINASQLAAMIGVTPSALSILWLDKTKQTRLAKRIYKALNMVDDTGPLLGVSRDDAFRRLTRAWPHLTDQERDLVVATSETLASKR